MSGSNFGPLPWERRKTGKRGSSERNRLFVHNETDVSKAKDQIELILGELTVEQIAELRAEIDDAFEEALLLYVVYH